MKWENESLEAFHDAVQSLKLYRRAELPGSDEDKKIIELLYVDSLPQEQIFRTVLKPNTTFIIGRKGTGKSTIFQRLQWELVKGKKQTSAYIDIKTLYESSQIDPDFAQKLKTLGSALPKSSLEKLLLYKTFLQMVIKEIKSELSKRARTSLWQKVKAVFSGNLHELFEDLDELLDETNDNKFISVLGLKQVDIQDSQSSSQSKSYDQQLSGNISATPEVSSHANVKSNSESSGGKEIKYSDILMATFNIRELLSRLRDVLHKLGVRNLYILIDDFSELPEQAQCIVVDTLLAPLNNWSDEFIKLKVAAYPGRIYYGAIDKTKIDEVYLDLFKLYGTSDVSSMEDKATEFTKRLVEQRFNYYKVGVPEEFFQSRLEPQEIWRQLFFATMANPRNLGYILHYLYETNLIFGKPIGIRAIQDASRRYYEEKIESYFAINKFLHESFSERSSIFSLKELLEDIVHRARELRSHNSALMHKISGKPPTSHFHVITDLETLLQTLELNFFPYQVL